MIIGALYILLVYVRPRGGSGKQSKKDVERERLKRQFTLIVNPNDQKTDEKGEDKGPYWN